MTTKITATFRLHGRDETADVMNPFCDDNTYVIQSAFGNIAIVEARTDQDAIDELAEDDHYGPSIRIDESSYEDYGEEFRPGDSLGDREFEKPTWINLKGEESEGSLAPYQTSGQGVFYDDEDIHIVHLTKANKVRYHGTYEDLLLPEGGVLFENFRKWYDKATEPADTRERRERRDDIRYDNYYACEKAIKEVFRLAENQGFSSVKLTNNLRCKVTSTHAWRQCGRDYQNSLGGYIQGYREQWEARVLEDRWAPNEDNPIDWIKHNEVSRWDRHTIHYIGRFYRDELPCYGKHYDKGDYPCYVMVSPIGTELYWDGENFGPLASAKLFWKYGTDGVYRHLGMIRDQVTKLVEQAGITPEALAANVWANMDEDEQSTWDSFENFVDVRTDDSLRYYFVQAMSLAQLQTWLDTTSTGVENE